MSWEFRSLQVFLNRLLAAPIATHHRTGHEPEFGHGDRQNTTLERRHYMNLVVTDEMLDLTVFVGVIFGILAAWFIAYGEIQRRCGRKGRIKGINARGKRKSGRGGKGR